MQNQKGFINLIIIGIVVVVVVAIVGYVAVQKSATPEIPDVTEEVADVDTVSEKDSATADWKTYRNEGYGFELKYPPTWQLIEKPRIIGKQSTGKNLFKLKGNTELCLLQFDLPSGTGFPPDPALRIESKKINIDGKNFESKFLYYEEKLRNITVYDFPKSNIDPEYLLGLILYSTEGQPLIRQPLSSACLETFYKIVDTIKIQ